MPSQPDRFLDPRFTPGTVVIDVKTGEYAVITNGRCARDHTVGSSWDRTHPTGGCLWLPCEGYVFQADADGKPTGWAMKDLTGRNFDLADDRAAETIRQFFDRKCDEMRRPGRRLRQV